MLKPTANNYYKKKWKKNIMHRLTYAYTYTYFIYTTITYSNAHTITEPRQAAYRITAIDILSMNFSRL